MAKKPADKTGRLNITDRKLRSDLKELIDHEPGYPSMTDAVRTAVSFRLQYLKIETKPIDYTTAPLDLLREYAVHGYDFTIRAPALAEIERRYQCARMTT